ncbi:cytochrome C [Mastigocoleus sp. MO_188.B34]|uniref:cytochrome C n=1 Tax=Mastigocoleus sp. MO_188.B34 TaxID=3036635 RepID=UPI002601C38B|nr:cytochrome C [Mastigocoleus sp. MO_188.B34]MDJ0693355.1 cytochrome C [Mastigocoleus sp. MO_188.B34]
MLKRRYRRKVRHKSIGMFVIVLVWSLGMGWLLAFANNAYSAVPSTEIGTVDVVPAKHKIGQELYLENCSSCHIALPPAVLPSQTWRNLLEDSQHYGATLKPLVDPGRILVWRYISTFSRPHKKDERTPYRVNSSRYFNALHPQVKLPRPVKLGSCVACHPGASDYNFRRLSSEWDNPKQ